MNKIAFVIHGLLVGGAEKFFLSLVNSLFQRNKNIITILLSDNNPLLDELNPEIKNFILTKGHKFDLSIKNRIKNILNDEEVNKVFCINEYSFFISKISQLKSNKKFYLSEHSTVPKSSSEFLKNWTYLQFFQEKNDEVLFVCKNQKEYYKRKYLFDKTNTHVIYNGIDINFFNRNKKHEFYKDLRKELNLTEQDIIILLVGTIRPEKGHSYAIEALQILHEKCKIKAHILFVGSGNQFYIKNLRELVEKLKLYDYIHFMGSHKDVRNFYYHANLFTLTSKNVETFSIAALEAMAFGLPCSLTNTGGASEMIIENFNGTLSQPKNSNSIAESWHTILRKQFDAKNIRNFVVDNFSLDKMVEEYSKLLFDEKYKR